MISNVMESVKRVPAAARSGVNSLVSLVKPETQRIMKGGVMSYNLSPEMDFVRSKYITLFSITTFNLKGGDMETM